MLLKHNVHTTFRENWSAQAKVRVGNTQIPTACLSHTPSLFLSFLSFQVGR